MCDILLLDQDSVLRSTLAEALRDEGFVVEDMGVAEQAMERLQMDRQPRILVTELGGNGVDYGLDVANNARQMRPDLPVILMTGQPGAEPGYRSSTLEYVVLKPFMPSYLSDIVREMLPDAGA